MDPSTCYGATVAMNGTHKGWVGIVAAAAALALAGCGSSNSGVGGAHGGAGGTKGGSGTAGCSAMSWLDDGAPECADFLSVTRSTKDGFDQLAVVGSETTGVGLTFKVIVPGGGAIELGKDYTCDGAYILFVYQAGALPSHSTTTCTLDVSALGSATAPAAGTFSATLLAADGVTTKQITQGAFSAVPKIAD